jgi:hypothetical protein
MKWEDLLKADWEERWEGAVHPEDPSKKFLGGKLPSKTGTKDDPLLARSRKALAGIGKTKHHLTHLNLTHSHHLHQEI